MSNVPTPNSPLKWLFPVIFLSIIALMALYIVRDNYNERTRNPAIMVNKDTRSDYVAPGMDETMNDTTVQKGIKPDSLARERGSQPVLDTTIGDKK